MKKLIIVLLCLSLTGFSACRSVEQPKHTTVTETKQKSTQQTSAETTTDPTFSFLTTTKTKPDKSPSHNDAIKGIIKIYGDSPDQLKGYFFAFYDLDSNGIQEFLLGVDYYWKNDVAILDVYVINSDVAVRQKEIDWDFDAILELGYSPGLPVLYKNGTIMMGRYAYYRLENGEIKRTTVIEKDGEYYSFIVNNPYPGTPITKEKFDRTRREFEGDGQVVDLDWKPLAEYGR